MSFFDDILYGVLLVISLLFGHYVRSNVNKKYLSSVLGLLMVIVVCRHDAFHSFIVCVVNAFIVVNVHPRYVCLHHCLALT